MYSNRKCIKHSNNVLITGRNCSDIDFRYGPYNSVNEAFNFLNENECIALGLTVGIKSSNGSIQEYWFKEGTTEVSYLVPKLIVADIDSILARLTLLESKVAALEGLGGGNTEQPVISYENLTVASLLPSTSTLTNAGGVITVLTNYSYALVTTLNSTELSRETKTTGATVVYSVSPETGVVISENSITLPLNNSTADKTYNITATVSIGTLTATKTVEVTVSKLVPDLYTAIFGGWSRENLINWDLDTALTSSDIKKGNIQVSETETVLATFTISIDDGDLYKGIWVYVPEDYEVTEMTDSTGSSATIATLEDNSRIFYNKRVGERGYAALNGTYKIKIAKIQ